MLKKLKLFGSLLIFVLANPLRYFIAWLVMLLLIILVIIMPFEIEINQANSIIFSIAAAVPVYLFRKEIKLILIGYMSGINLALAIIPNVVLIDDC